MMHSGSHFLISVQIHPHSLPLLVPYIVNSRLFCVHEDLGISEQLETWPECFSPDISVTMMTVKRYLELCRSSERANRRRLGLFHNGQVIYLIRLKRPHYEA